MKLIGFSPLSFEHTFRRQANGRCHGLRFLEASLDAWAQHQPAPHQF